MSNALWGKNGTKNVVITNRSQRIRRRLWWALFIFISTVILSFSFLPPQVNLTAGSVSTEDIYYTGMNTTYTSDLRTEAAKQNAATEVGQIYRIDNNVVVSASNKIDKIFAAINEIIATEGLQQEAKIARFKEVVVGDYTNNQIKYVLTTSSDARYNLQSKLLQIITNIMRPGITEDKMTDALTTMTDSINALNITDNGKGFLTILLGALDLNYNKAYDPVATTAAVDKAMNAVSPVQVMVQTNELIVAKGNVITAEDVEALQILGMQSETSRIMIYIGILMFVVILYLLIILYVRIYQPEMRARGSNIIIVGLIINIALIISKFISLFSGGPNVLISSQIGYLFPLAGFSMLLAVLLNAQIAVLITVLLSICVGFISGGQLSFTIVSLISGLVAIYCTASVNQRSQFVRASVQIACTNIFIIIAWGLIWNHSPKMIGTGVLLGVINGILSSVLAMGILPFMESGFRITTVVRLLELSNSNHPLLKRLMMEAPGTYQHSVLVGNLAETAADAVGADPLLVRVASYFHDIGKIKRPYFFIENQIVGDNPHDKLQPSLSHLIITSHVKDGIEMMKEYKIPDEITDIIEQHHGTGVLKIFYYKALENPDSNETVKEDDFRYPGPKPQTKEAAIVMLADSVQAAVQSLQSPTKDQIEKMVREVIKQKVDDEQLNDCHLTFKDLETIRQCFINVLVGINHQRIVYPEMVAKEMNKKHGSKA